MCLHTNTFTRISPPHAAPPPRPVYLHVYKFTYTTIDIIFNTLIHEVCLIGQRPICSWYPNLHPWLLAVMFIVVLCDSEFHLKVVQDRCLILKWCLALSSYSRVRPPVYRGHHRLIHEPLKQFISTLHKDPLCIEITIAWSLEGLL